MKRYFPIVLLLVPAAAFFFGVLKLFQLRFETGDVYPPYSSLRSDPIGAMAFYESVEQLPEFTVRRDFSTTGRLPDSSETTYFHIAASISEFRGFSEEAIAETEQFAAGGGRVVITMFPASSAPAQQLNREQAETRAEPAGKQKPKATPYRDRWGVDVEVVSLTQRQGAYEPAYEPLVVQNESGLAIPEVLDWKSAIVFRNLNPEWKRIYTRGPDPVMIQRQFGRGAVVIATDSFFLSNQAMQMQRHADLLAWLIGPNRTVVFDEAHLGVADRPGVATLMRRYRLHWFVAGLIVLALLFIWKNSVSLLPRRDEETASNYLAGKDAATGFINLLRRSIPAGDLLAICFNEWKKSAEQSGKYSRTRIHQAQAAFNAENSTAVRDRDPLRAYRTISRILHTQDK